LERFKAGAARAPRNFGFGWIGRRRPNSNMEANVESWKGHIGWTFAGFGGEPAPRC
jgi:hypothetical protein